jgi:hypothetical protein
LLLRRSGALERADEDDNTNDVDLCRPCRFIQFVSISDKLLMRQQQQQQQQRSGEDTVSFGWRRDAAAAALWNGDGDAVHSARTMGSGVLAKAFDEPSSDTSSSGASDEDRSSLYDSDDECGSSSCSSIGCDSSSVASDLTTDPRLFALLPYAVRDRAVATEAVENDDDGGGNGLDDDEDRFLPDYQKPPPAWNQQEWAVLALVVMSILVLLIDVAWSAVMDLAARWWINNVPPPPPSPMAAPRKNHNGDTFKARRGGINSVN